MCLLSKNKFFVLIQLFLGSSNLLFFYIIFGFILKIIVLTDKYFGILSVSIIKKHQNVLKFEKIFT